MRLFFMFLIYLLLASCSTNFEKNFEVTMTTNNYRLWIDYCNKEKDSIEIDWLLSYKIYNNTFKDVKLQRVRKRPDYSYDAALFVEHDSLILFEEIIKYKTTKELTLYCTKKVALKHFPNHDMIKKNHLINFGDYHKNITNLPKEQIEFRKSSYFQNLLKSIENDSIAIVFRDKQSYDYFQFKGVIKDKKLKFSR